MRTKVFFLILSLCSFKAANAQKVEELSAKFAEGVVLTSLVDWLMDQAYGSPGYTKERIFDYKLKKNTLTVLIQAALDPVFEHNLVNIALPVTDPRRYVILAMFQGGRFAYKALDFVHTFAIKLAEWFVEKNTKPDIIKVFKEDDLNQWITGKEETCPSNQPTVWDKLLSGIQTAKTLAGTLGEVSISCIVMYLISRTTSQVLSKMVGQQPTTLVALGVKLISQTAGTAGSTYLVDWAKNSLKDLSFIETVKKLPSLPELTRMIPVTASVTPLLT
jgi:hypothetical protein